MIETIAEIAGRLVGVLVNAFTSGKTRNEALQAVADEALSMRSAESAADLRALAKFENFRP